MTLKSDLSDLSDLSDKMGAPVFALAGYAAASHVIPRGSACRSLVGLGQKITAEVILAYFSGLLANPPPPQRARRRETEADVSA